MRQFLVYATCEPHDDDDAEDDAVITFVLFQSRLLSSTTTSRSKSHNTSKHAPQMVLY